MACGQLPGHKGCDLNMYPGLYHVVHTDSKLHSVPEIFPALPLKLAAMISAKKPSVENIAAVIGETRMPFTSHVILVWGPDLSFAAFSLQSAVSCSAWDVCLQSL